MMKPDNHDIDVYERLVNRSAVVDAESGDVDVLVDKDDDLGNPYVNCGLSIMIQWHVPLVLYLLSKIVVDLQSYHLFNVWYASEVFWLIYFNLSCFHLLWSYFKTVNPDKAIADHLSALMIVSILWDVAIMASVGAIHSGIISI